MSGSGGGASRPRADGTRGGRCANELCEAEASDRSDGVRFGSSPPLLDDGRWREWCGELRRGSLLPLAGVNNEAGVPPLLLAWLRRFLPFVPPDSCLDEERWCDLRCLPEEVVVTVSSSTTADPPR